MNKKNFLVGGVLVLAFLIYSFYNTGDSETQQTTNSPSSSTTSNASSTVETSKVRAARQYQSDEEEIFTVWEYDTEVFALGAGLDRLTLPRLPDSPTPYFSNGKFSLTLGDGTVRVWLDDVPYYEGRERYNDASWELLIPDTCQRYFDGCNSCVKDGGCTKMFCNDFQQPICTDDIADDESEIISDIDEAISDVE